MYMYIHIYVYSTKHVYIYIYIVVDPQLEFVNVGYKHLELAKVILKSCSKNCGA